ncbi:MAG: hypothetical protein ACNS61_04055 [Candidatus Wenzhouxiangella sp. M2_3B_020]
MSRGLLDWPGVVLGWINAPLVAVLPEAVVLAFWAAVSSFLTMWVYRHFSNQEKLAALRPQVKAVQKKLSNYDGEFSGLKPLIMENFRLSGRHILLALGPALLAGIPVLFVLVWVSNAYGVKFPEAGTPVQVRAIAAGDMAATDWRWDGAPTRRLEGLEAPGTTWSVPWPESGDPIALHAADGTTVVELPPERPTPVLHQRQWWNALIGNPGGYLGPGNPAAAIHLDLPKKEMLPFGPTWMRGWEFLYFVLLVVGSLALKFIWRIH